MLVEVSFKPLRGVIYAPRGVICVTRGVIYAPRGIFYMLLEASFMTFVVKVTLTTIINYACYMIIVQATGGSIGP